MEIGADTLLLLSNCYVATEYYLFILAAIGNQFLSIPSCEATSCDFTEDTKTQKDVLKSEELANGIVYSLHFALEQYRKKRNSYVIEGLKTLPVT